MKKVTLALIGAGERGIHAYAPYALNHPHEAAFVAVAEPKDDRRELFRKLHNIDEKMCFKSWEEMLEQPKLADAVVICTGDNMHFKPVIKAIEKGYHALLEKPMSNDPGECVTIGDYARKYRRIVSVCHVLRYTSFFSTIKRLLDEGRIGRLISIQHNENVAFWHQAHSYVRGNWRNSVESSPMILSKSCHDMDIILWLAGADCTSISSFGSLAYFRSENAPEGAPCRCLDGCPAENECPYYAPKLYLKPKAEWPANAISLDTSIEARTKALKEGPYGRCVFHCDNDVVDHQVVNMEFENGVTAAFTMCAFTKDCNRTIKLMGTKAEIRGTLEGNEIEIRDFNTGNVEVILLAESRYGHSGGDYGIMHDFVRILRDSKDQDSGEPAEGLTSAGISVQSHMMAFAAEKSRLDKRVIDLKEFYKSYEQA